MLPTGHSYIFTACIISIIKTYFPCKFIFTVLNANDDISDIIKRTNFDSCHSLFIRNNFTIENSNFNEGYIITVEDLSQLANDFKHLSFDIFWNNSAYFVVTLKNINDPLEEIFKIFLHYKIFNVILITNWEREIRVYTYFPYEEGACAKHISKIKMIGNCTQTDTNNYYSNKIPYDIKKCSINIVIHNMIPNTILETCDDCKEGAIGSEQYLFNIISSIENIKTNYIVVKEKENFGLVFQGNLTTTGLMRFLEDGEADIAFGGILLVKGRINKFDFIWGFNHDTLKIFFPRLREVKWKMIFKEFSITVWLLILSTFIIIIFTINVIVYAFVRQKTNQRDWDHVHMILILWGYIFDNTNCSVVESRKIRFIFSFWIWFAFFINNFYRTSLYSITTTRGFIPPFKNLESIQKAGYKPCFSIAMRKFLQYNYNLYFDNYVNKRECQIVKDTLLTTASSENLFSIAFLTSYTQSEHLFIDNEGYNTLDYIDFIGTHSLVPYFYRGFPYLKRYQKIARHVFEAGLIKHHFDSIRLKNGVRPVLPTKKFEIINLGDLKIPFIVLIIGYSLSLLILTFEIKNKNYK